MSELFTLFGTLIGMAFGAWFGLWLSNKAIFDGWPWYKEVAVGVAGLVGFAIAWLGVLLAIAWAQS